MHIGRWTDARLIGFALAIAVPFLATFFGRRKLKAEEAPAKPRRILAVTRMHTKQSDSTMHPKKLEDFGANVLQYAAGALAMIDVGDDLRSIGTYQALQSALNGVVPDNLVRLQPVAPWGPFVAALNAAVTIAVNEGFDLILFQSLEMKVSADTVAELLQHLNSDTLVVGAALQGHEFLRGTHELRGRTCPWNTLALWDVQKLGLTGFPLIGNGMPPHAVPAGVEELTAISLLQSFREDCKAKLVQVENVQWETQWADAQRQKWHEEKMNSKDSRPRLQLQQMQLPAGKVEHVVSS